MSVTFAVETAFDVLRDAAELFPRQWEELALDKDKVPQISPAYERYENLEKMGYLQCVTVRDEGRMVGYYIDCVIEHLHYAKAGLMAHTDLYYLLPEYRTGGTGTKMLIFREEELKKRGVVKIYSSTKVHRSNQGLFEALGYKVSDIVLVKYVGD